MTSTGPRVNVPVDPATRDRDIENKLRLYGIWNGFKHNKLPSNKQIDVALNSFTNSKQLTQPNDKLSEEGKHLLADFRNVVEQAKILLLTKNNDQALQEFIWHTEQLTVKNEAAESTEKPSLPVPKSSAERDRQKALEGLRTLGTLIISNGQFRKILNDAQILLRDIVGDAASRAAHRIGPTEEELAQMDRPAEENVWHDAPDLSKESIKNQFRQTVERHKLLQRDDVKQAAGQATQAADPADSRDPLDTAGRTAHDQRYGTESGVDARAGLRTGVETLRDRAHENIPDEHQERAKRQWGAARDIFNEKLHEDRRKQTIWRLKKMVVEIQGHRDYERAIDVLLELAETYRGHARTAVDEGRQQASSAREDDHLQRAETLLKTLIERFANYTSLDDLIDSINNIYRDADKDPELRSWFRKMDSYVRRCLKTQGYIMTDDATREWNQLHDDGNFLLRERYREHTDRVMNEFKFIADQFADDPESNKFGNAVQKLFTDLGNDENGKPTFKKHLVKDITQVIIPDIFENIRYVPVPRIEYSDPMIDAVIENLIIESDNLMPNIFEISNDSYFRWGRKNMQNINRQSFMVALSGIQCDLRDVSYYVKKKQGFPSLTDTGIADFFLGGTGLSLKLHLSSAGKHHRAHFFKCDKVDVRISGLSVKLKNSTHKVLFSLLNPILLKVMKPVVTRVIAKQVQDYFGKLDAFSYRVYQEQRKAKLEIANDPENAPNVYRRYAQALRNELMRKKQQAEHAVEDKEMKMAVTKEDSIDRFKHISLPGGISTKATEYRDLARRGDRWQSDVFSIGSASPSSNLPETQRITRKSPHAHPVSVKDRTVHPASSATYSGTTRASRDSGYHGLEPAAPGYTGVGDRVKDEKLGSTGNQLAGGYTLNAPVSNPERDTLSTGGRYYTPEY
ncbi:hypothetical protein BDZ91DRAFT_687019 [Kalaharituber pfeilii]|nr:hypothetical protein BDZ91DRAFT_687019 [Kalaharituber pfeilii]